MAQQNPLPKISLPGMDGQFAQHYSNLVDTVNSLMGFNGEIVLNNHLSLSGNRIKNLGEAADPSDAVTHALAEASYSATALQPKLESTGSNPLRSVRRISDPNQRETSSSFLNDLLSTPPSANQIIPLTSAAMGGISVTIPAGLFTFADQSSVYLQSRTDLLTLPTAITITSISCVGNLVTVVTSAPTGVVVGQGVTIAGVSPASFNGSFTVVSVLSSTSFTYQADLGTVSGSGGRVELNNVWYYSVTKRSNYVRLFGPLSGDTAANRLTVNFDSFQIIAVVVLTSTGSNVASSGGGGSAIVGSPTAGVFF
jgi:hypothetical protein